MRKIGDAHNLSYASVVLQPIRRHEAGSYGGKSHKIYGGSGDTIVAVLVLVVGFMVAEALQEMLEVVGNEVKPAEEQEDRHSEAREDLDSLETKRVPDAAPLPYFEVAQNIDYHADGSTASIEEDEMGQGHGSQRALALEENVHGDSKVAQAPIQTAALVGMHALPSFSYGRDGQGGREDGWRSWWRFLEDLVLCRYATVFVSVTTALADVLCHLGLEKISSCEGDIESVVLTDLTGPAEMTWV